MKCASGIGKYISQVCCERTQTNTAAAEGCPEAVGGHGDAMRFEGSIVWKRHQDGGRGQAEADFLATACKHNFLCRYVPKFHGVKSLDGSNWTGMENSFSGLDAAAILDLKMGTRTWDNSATPEKTEKAMRKSMGTTTATLGVRVVGGKFPVESGGAWERLGHKMDKDVRSEEELATVLARFLRTPELRRQARAHVEELLAWFTEQREYAFYASSLLMGCDGADPKPKDLRFKMIDFAHVEPCPPDGDQSYITGLATLRRVLATL